MRLICCTFPSLVVINLHVIYDVIDLFIYLFINSLFYTTADIEYSNTALNGIKTGE